MPTTRTLTNNSGAELRYRVLGAGLTVLGLHGAYSTHEEIASVIERVLGADAGIRRLYPDLPGMGESPAHDSVRSANDVVELLDALVAKEVGAERFFLIGHSYGAHLARGIVARRPRQVCGLVLICPVIAGAAAEEHVVVRAFGDPADSIESAQLDDYRGYFVVQTPETAARFGEAVAPSLGRYDSGCVGAQMHDLALCPDPDDVSFSAPVLILTARHDSFVGFRDQLELIDRYPNATHVVVADAGHALPHEHPTVTDNLLRDWLDRCRHLPATNATTN